MEMVREREKRVLGGKEMRDAVPGAEGPEGSQASEESE